MIEAQVTRLEEGVNWITNKHGWKAKGLINKKVDREKQKKVK